MRRASEVIWHELQSELQMTATCAGLEGSRKSQDVNQGWLLPVPGLGPLSERMQPCLSLVRSQKKTGEAGCVPVPGRSRRKSVKEGGRNWKETKNTVVTPGPGAALRQGSDGWCVCSRCWALRPGCQLWKSNTVAGKGRTPRTQRKMELQEGRSPGSHIAGWRRTNKKHPHWTTLPWLLLEDFIFQTATDCRRMTL
ncbi:uncharacterized protein AAES06_008578 isoform 2-T3 [Glossophaga mutica]